MVKNSITVFTRLRKPSNQKSVDYIVNKFEEHEELTIFNKQGCSKYNFKKVFDKHNTQNEVFEHVAKPVVKSIFDGVNGTIFAYGQTGSGKTYSISGCSKNFTQRGIIPRTLEYIFDYIKLLDDDFSLSVSYLEIYNENVYDLLKRRDYPMSREKQQRIMMLEGGRSGMQLRNLKTIPVQNVREALKLLVVGESNRATSETFLNDRSSRSHCIFTIYLKIRNPKSSYVKCSKLNIIDLAGSERVYKSHLNGLVLREAQHINLSLHYLEHVILALSENKRHIPYRNCVMTYLLKDSLTGNCLTVMLATLNVEMQYIQETITTCKFSQRVAKLNTDVQTNLVLDPEYQIECLKYKINDLEKALDTISSLKCKGDITEQDQAEILASLEKYLGSDEDYFEVEPDLNVIQFCFKTLKDRIRSLEDEKASRESLSSLDYVPEREISCTMPAPFASKLSTHTLQKREELFRRFLLETQEQNTVDKLTTALNNKFDMAKVCSETIKQCQENINCIRKKLSIISREKEREQLNRHLNEQQLVYKESLALLQQIKSDTDNLEVKLQNEKLELLKNFKDWLIVENTEDFNCDDVSLLSSLSFKATDKVAKLSQIDEEAGSSYNVANLLLTEDGPDFCEFVKTLTLTGDMETDREILTFYRSKYQ